jgi:CRP/FNR family transcriptional regulator, cyclic AMP receptor protein
MLTPRLRAARELDAPPSAGPPGEITIAPLLDLDPALGHALTPALHDQVRPWLVVPVWPLKRGPWPSSLTSAPGMMGLLLLDGVVTRSVRLGRIAYPELLGAGDLIRPWEAGGIGGPLAVHVDWQVVEPATVAVLDQRFAALVGRWPEIVDELVGRAMRRADDLDLHMAIAQLPLLELRLHALMWHLAGRWGMPTDDGVLIPVRLTHSLLSALVLGRRSSTSRAINALVRRGVLERTADGWMLYGDPPTEMHMLSRRDAHLGLDD